MRDEEFGRGQNPGLGWNDPTFGTRCVAKVTVGSFQPSSVEGIVFGPRPFPRQQIS